jgi:hypothetical protein
MKTNKLIIASLILTILVGIVFVTGADELITTFFSKSVTIDKAERDFLLTKVPEVSKDVKEIKMNITISCDTGNCNYKATQKGLPTIVGKVTRCSTECLKISDDILRTCLEENKVCLDMKGVETLVSNQIVNRLEIYAKQNMPLQYTEVSKGTITVEEK